MEVVSGKARMSGRVAKVEVPGYGVELNGMNSPFMKLA